METRLCKEQIRERGEGKEDDLEMTERKKGSLSN